MQDEKMKSDIKGVTGDFMKMMNDLLKRAPQTYKMFPWL